MPSGPSGKELRRTLPRSVHAGWEPHPERPGIVEFLNASSKGRVPDLIPVRYWRMTASPFAFLRGAPSIMAYDLATTSRTTGLFVQACGDAHLQNFGIFATAERNVIFDINDFDETLPAPWEWDVKRLAASVHVAGRVARLSEKRSTAAVLAAVRAYRARMRQCSEMTSLEVWYSRIDASAIVDLHDNPMLRQASRANDTAPAHTHELVASDYTEQTGGEPRIVDKPPKLFHPTPETETIHDADSVIERYRSSVRDDVRVLLGRYNLADLAIKVVGIGSVGTRCAVALLTASESDRLLLQIKEARPSVYEEYVDASRYARHGERVVAGQRLMQAASDVFLGWTYADDGHEFYVRQLNDLKVSIDVMGLDGPGLTRYSALCGEVLALAHARSGDTQAIAGYMGTSGSFERAIAIFAARYADRNERDYESFMDAIATHRILTREG